MSIKGRNSVKIWQKMTSNNPKLGLVDVDMVDVHTKFGQILKIWRKMMGNNPKLDLVNVDVHTNFGQILSIHYQDIERKRNSDVNQGLQLRQNFAKNDGQQSQARSCRC